MSRRLGIVAIVAFLVGVLATSFFVPAAFVQVCEQGAQPCYSQHALLVAAKATAELLNYLSSAIIALATIAVALFTRFLYRATKIGQPRSGNEPLWRSSRLE